MLPVDFHVTIAQRFGLRLLDSLLRFLCESIQVHSIPLPYFFLSWRVGRGVKCDTLASCSKSLLSSVERASGTLMLISAYRSPAPLLALGNPLPLSRILRPEDDPGGM